MLGSWWSVALEEGGEEGWEEEVECCEDSKGGGQVLWKGMLVI